MIIFDNLSIKLRRLFKFFKPISIDSLLYEVKYKDYQMRTFSKIDLSIDQVKGDGRIIYRAFAGGQEVHHSHLFPYSVTVMQFGYGKYSVIGDCATIPEYRGLGIYPHMLNYIVGDLKIIGHTDRVYILVSPDNSPSIKGIERAGFQYLAHLQGTRFGPVMMRTQVK